MNDNPSIEERMKVIKDEFDGNSEKYINERVLAPISKEDMRVIIDEKFKEIEEYRKDPSKMLELKGYPEALKMGELEHQERRFKNAEYMLTGGNGGFEKNFWYIKSLTDRLTDEEQMIIESINLASRQSKNEIE